jgi:hypothetical protein
MHTYSVEGVDGTLLLTDTPGLGDPGPDGRAREAEALELASRADLVLFVLDHDLTRADRHRLLVLSRLGKRLIAVLNKKDRFPEADHVAILARLRERLEGVLLPEDVVAIAANPAPVPVRVRQLDGTTVTELEFEAPKLDELEKRVAEIFEMEGDSLRASTLLLGARLREQAEQTRLSRQRRDQAQAIIERHQWLAAVTAFANPIPALGPMAAGAVQLRMLSELASAYHVPLSADSLEMVGRQMAETFFRLGLAETAASLIAGIFKFNPLGFAAGGTVQAVTMAYLTRITGAAFLEYLEHGKTWGEGGVQAVVTRHFEASRTSGWFLQFAKAVLGYVVKR